VLKSRLYIPLAEHQARIEAAAEVAAIKTLDLAAEAVVDPSPPPHPPATAIDTLYGQIVWSLGRCVLDIHPRCTNPVRRCTCATMVVGFYVPLMRDASQHHLFSTHTIRQHGTDMSWLMTSLWRHTHGTAATR
jgi:hypothetical protein